MQLQKNCENMLDKVNGWLSKWILPKMSYRGQGLVINNLVSFALWHRLTFVEPPVPLLSNIQRVLVDIWGDKLHWIPQSVLFPPREEGGRGLVHLASRGAACCFQFNQRLLTGPPDIVWRRVSCSILQQLGGMCLDLCLFLMDLSKLSSSLQLFIRVFFLCGLCWGRGDNGLHWFGKTCTVWQHAGLPCLGQDYFIQTAPGCMSFVFFFIWRGWWSWLDLDWTILMDFWELSSVNVGKFKHCMALFVISNLLKTCLFIYVLSSGL